MSPLRRRRRPAPPPPEAYDAEATVPVDRPPSQQVVYEEQVPLEAPPRRPRIWPWLLLLLLLVLGGLGALAYFATRDDDDGDASPRTTVAQAAVPDVVGQRADRGVARLLDAGFKADLRRTLSKRASGIVLRQDPAAGNRAQTGSTVVLTVSRGQDTNAVPAVVGLPVGEAFAKVEVAKLRPGAVRVFSPKPVGQVIAQEPGGGTELKREAIVKLRVSRGRQPVDVPDVVGTTAAEATSQLESAGLKADLFRVPADEPEGTVIAQKPLAGERAPRGSAVRVNVSEGRSGTTTTATTTATTTTATTTTTTSTAARATVPDVVGQKQVAAVRALRAAGLDADTKQVPSREPRGTVVAQFPAAGSSAKSGSAVRINVSKGPQQAGTKAVPDLVADDEQTARQRLEQAGFKVRVLRQDTADETEDGVVVDQDPLAGTRLNVGARVTIYVGVFTG
ncbi:MAG: PASTA domain-containing protein [Gaiellaceae bacterium]